MRSWLRRRPLNSQRCEPQLRPPKAGGPHPSRCGATPRRATFPKGKAKRSVRLAKNCGAAFGAAINALRFFRCPLRAQSYNSRCSCRARISAAKSAVLILSTALLRKEETILFAVNIRGFLRYGGGAAVVKAQSRTAVVADVAHAAYVGAQGAGAGNFHISGAADID